MIVVRKIRSGIKKLILASGSCVRKFLIQLLEENVQIGKNVVIGSGAVIKTSDGGRIVIGDNVAIEERCFLYAQAGTIAIDTDCFIGTGTQIIAKESVGVGKYCLIAAYTVIRDADHGTKMGLLINSQQYTVSPIFIGNDVWLGSHSVITKGCEIGDGAVVGANAVVTRNVEPMSIVGGVPAKFIKNRMN